MDDKLHSLLLATAITMAILDLETLALLSLAAALLNIIGIVWALREDANA